jgi:DNA-binding MarR family transcriptional regulator
MLTYIAPIHSPVKPRDWCMLLTMTGPTTDDALALLHFAFREVVREPDTLLAARGLGRVHHRLLYMCRRHQGLTVNGLCSVLEISKQALHRPLAELVAEGLVKKAFDTNDGRRRIVTLTAAGRAFERKLSEPQRAAFDRAFSELGRTAASHWADVMRVLANGKDEASLLDQAE